MKRGEIIRKSSYFLLPSFLLMAFVYAIPLLTLLYYSFASWRAITPTCPIGLHNYAQILLNSEVSRSFARSFLIVGITVPASVIISVILAHFLYQRIPGWQFYIVVLFIPIILPIAVIGVVFTHFFTTQGPFNLFLKLIGLGVFTRNWLADLKTAIYTLIGTAIWWEISFATMIFYARMMAINPSLYEAAVVDGANEIHLIRYVTLPQLRGVIQFYVVLAIIYFLNQTFTYVFVMTGGGPGYATTTVDYFIYLNAFKYMKLGIASALAVLITLGLLLLVHVYLSISKEEEKE